MKRPMRIGRLSARLVPGVFVVENLVIEGLSPKDRPFLTAKTITVKFPWWSIVTRKMIVESVDMTDWDMTVETFPNGRHSFPKIMPERKEPRGPSRFTTTVRSVLASRGQFTYLDHGTPWSTVARNLTVSLYRSDLLNDYRGAASFSNGTIKIQSYEPFSAGMTSRFRIVDGKAVFDRMDLISDGARSAVTGTVDFKNWPEQLYHVRSHIDFPTQKNIFFHRDRFDVSGQGDFDGTFHLFKGGRELKGTFTSPVAGVNDWRFPNLRGRVLWLPTRLEITESTADLYGGSAQFDYRMAPMGNRAVPTQATWDVSYKNVDLSMLTDFLETRGLRLAGRATGRNSLQWALGKWSQKRGGGTVEISAPAGVQTMTRAIPADRLAQEAQAPPDPGPFNRRLSLGYLPVAGRIEYRARSRRDHHRPELGRDRQDLRRVRRAHGIRTPVEDAVPRDEPGLAGERSRARRHHDRVRVEYQCDRDRRSRRIRRRDARVVHAAADRGAVQRRSACGRGTSSGGRPAPTS